MPKYESPYDPSSAPNSLEHLKYEKKGHVAYVTINRPDVRNALHTYAYIELRACWRDMQIDPNIYVGIVTGAGPAFCAGRDVKFLAQHQGEGKDHNTNRDVNQKVPVPVERVRQYSPKQHANRSSAGGDEAEEAHRSGTLRGLGE